MFVLRKSLLLCAFTSITLVHAATLSASPNSDLQKGSSASFPGKLPDGALTDLTKIVQTVGMVNQKGGSSDDQPPGHPPAGTSVTAIDGELVSRPVKAAKRSFYFVKRYLNKFVRRHIGTHARRQVGGFKKIFSGTGTNLDSRDASIQGTAYLTFTVIPNDGTYNADACVEFCSGIKGCVFVNLYYEFNNPGLDAGGSNLKCAAYGDVHYAEEKTNFGGQDLGGAGPTYIQESSGYAKISLVEPAAPDGYDYVFGPVNASNNAPGYMGFAFIDQYDVNACAELCNTRGADPQGGACQYFNIWRAVVDEIPTTYSCAMYYIPTDESTAVNEGQGNLKVTFSRGYKRISYVPDGGFESYACADGATECSTSESSSWTLTSPGSEDILLWNRAGWAHSGSSLVSFGSFDGSDELAGTLTPISSLQLVAGNEYLLQFWHSSSFNTEADEADAFLEVSWNGDVIDSIHPGSTPWTRYEYKVTAAGNDQLSFRGGKYPAYSFLDDVSVFTV